MQPLLMAVLGWMPTLLQADSAAADNFAEATQLLQDKSFKQKAAAIDLLAASGDERARDWLEALLKGRLYVHKQDGSIAFVSGSIIRDALSNNKISSADKADYQKITVNNPIRKQLRSGIARLSVSSPDPEVRLRAVNNMLDSIDADNAALLQELAGGESDARVREAMQLRGEYGGAQ
ncbi:MAG: hypothetical protein R3E95_19640 [Thiolinea sp.]